MKKTEEEIYDEMFLDIRERLEECKTLRDLFELRGYVKLEHQLEFEINLAVRVDGCTERMCNLKPNLELGEM